MTTLVSARSRHQLVLEPLLLPFVRPVEVLRGLFAARPAHIPQPEWARVPPRAWRRQSALLTCLYEERRSEQA